MHKNICVLGMDPFNREAFDRVEAGTDYRFHDLLDFGWALSVAAAGGDLLEPVRARLEAFEGPIDGIVDFWDFPVQTLGPVLRQELGLPGATLEAVLKCEHKYWSRLEQARAVPSMVPDFQVVPVDRPDVRERLTIPYPLWLKPIKGTNSELGFRVDDDEGFDRAITHLRRELHGFAEFFDRLMAHAKDVPEDVARVGGRYGIAESLLEGEQATVSGFVHRGVIHVYGIVDSLNYPGTSSFSRYRYPSRLPSAVQRRMAEATGRILEQIGFDDQAFNIEFFWDGTRERLSVLEVNPRISQSHGDLYQKVDGYPNHRIMADLSVGRRPIFPRRAGRFSCAAKCYLRRFEDGTVTHVPTPEQVRRIQREIPGTRIQLKVGKGDRLSRLPKQDSYSFELAQIYLGADDDRQILERYDRCVEALGIQIEA